MYDFRELHTRLPSPAELVLWASIVAGPAPVVGPDAHGWPGVTGWSAEAPTVALNKDGAYMTCLTYRGGDVTMMEADERLVYLHRLHDVLKRLGTGWALLADETHVEALEYPTSQWSNPVACFLDASRRALVTSGQLYESVQVLTLTWLPPSSRKQEWYETFFTTGDTVRTTDTENRESFLRQVQQWGDALAGVLPRVRWLNPDEMCTYLKNTVCWDRTPMKMPATPFFLDVHLTTGDFLPGHTPQLGQVLPERHPPRLERYLRPIAVKTWPDELGHTIPAALQGVSFPYRFTVRWIALDKVDGEAVLKDVQGKWAQLIWDGWAIVRGLFPADAETQAASLESALLDMRDDRMCTGYLTPIVTVWGDTLDELAQRERAVLKLLQGQGLLCMPEVVGAAQAWQGTLPGDTYHGVPLDPFPSLALAFLLPHSTIWSGEDRDGHFHDVPLFTTSSDGAPFRAVLHPRGSEVGNFRVTGPTRRGKSAKFGFAALQFLRYANAQVFCFDTDYQFYCATMLVGGAHYDLGTSSGAGFHVLGRVDESDDERRWAQGWLEEVFEAQGLPPTAAEKAELWEALARLAAFPAHLRTLSTFRECFQVRRLKPALVPFLRGETYPYFDASGDSFRLDWWTTFEMRHILEQPGALPHVMQYIFHRMEERFDGRPTLILEDEFQALHEHPIMQRQSKDYLKRKAKKNVSVGLSWQEIVDASESPLWQAIQASCDTDLYVPNDKALNEDVAVHYRKMGLRPGEIAAIAMARPFSDYLYKTKDGARLYQLRLSPLERALCAASTQDEIAAMRQLVTQARTESLCAAWLRRQGFCEEADLFEQVYMRTTQASSRTGQEEAGWLTRALR